MIEFLLKSLGMCYLMRFYDIDVNNLHEAIIKLAVNQILSIQGGKMGDSKLLGLRSIFPAVSFHLKKEFLGSELQASSLYQNSARIDRVSAQMESQDFFLQKEPMWKTSMYYLLGVLCLTSIVDDDDDDDGRLKYMDALCPIWITILDDWKVEIKTICSIYFSKNQQTLLRSEQWKKIFEESLLANMHFDNEDLLKCTCLLLHDMGVSQDKVSSYVEPMLRSLALGLSSDRASQAWLLSHLLMVIDDTLKEQSVLYWKSFAGMFDRFSRNITSSQVSDDLMVIEILINIIRWMWPFLSYDSGPILSIRSWIDAWEQHPAGGRLSERLAFCRDLIDDININ